MKCKTRQETMLNKNKVDELLEDIIPKYLAIFPNISEDLLKILEKKNIFSGIIYAIMGSARPTTDLEEIEELGSFLQALYQVCITYKQKDDIVIPRLEELNPELYYEVNEISSINLYKKSLPENGNKMKFFVHKNAENHYVCPYVSIKDYIEYYNAGLITYNPNTQRGTIRKYNKKLNEITEEIQVYRKGVDEIVQELEKSSFGPNTLTLNIRENGYEIFDDGGMKVKDYGWLTIVAKDKSSVDLLDGMHRTLAYKKFLEINPNADNYTSLSIFHFDEKQAIHHIKQENKGVKISSDIIAKKDPENAGVSIAKDLNIKCVTLRGKIAIDMLEIISQQKYTDILTLGSCINIMFTEIQQRPAYIRKLTNYLIKFYELAVDLYKDYFDEKCITNNQFYQRKNIFITLTCLASKLYEKENWEDELFTLLENNLTIDKLLSITSNKKKIKDLDIKTINHKLDNMLSKEGVVIC
ncbi:hypothetical protein G8V07_11430 [Clostridium botulinum D/C]|uniref:hypothetical protein n=1 Tax=Clostridium botulinum TaxID=1491 RepID=UPI001E29D058|nr:hypothetical protein [Clostridium botulinum]MCD3319496.1 hypothetical protein [Clostridium botulinum D/C]MCD3324361.1 hypothetical protein [Clostridium botulinum D/C]MCD3327362.1 hypothetical protein [Clostridium botulinum D/C]